VSSPAYSGREDLSGVLVGLSVSESEDLARLGFAETHMRMVLGELARSLLLAGASILYGGRIDPCGYTDFLRREIERYGDREGGLLVFLPWPVHRAMTLQEIATARSDLGIYGELVCLGADGERVVDDTDRGENPPPVSEEEAADSLSAARQKMVECATVRILAGGRRQGFAGHMPGVLEEALLSIDAAQPLFLAGGFGGITADIATELGLDPDGVLPAFGDLSPEHAEIAERAEQAGWSPGRNALDADEARRLAVSHRPGEVASLVLSGLHRLANTDQDKRLELGDG
jgi:SLOG cluster2